MTLPVGSTAQNNWPCEPPASLLRSREVTPACGLTPASQSSEVSFYPAETFPSIIPVLYLRSSIFLFVIVCMCDMCSYVCIHACGNQSLMPRCLPGFLPTLLTEAESHGVRCLLNWRFRRASLSQGLPACLCSAGFTGSTPWPPNFCEGSGDLNSAHQASPGNTSSTGPSSQPDSLHSLLSNARQLPSL